VKLHNPEVFELIHPDDRAFIKKTFESAVRNKTDYDVHHRAILPDGALKYIHSVGHPVLNANGDVTEFVGMIVDVTEQTMAEAALREAKARTERVLDSITDKFFALDKDWRFTKFNKHAEEQLRILGKDPAKMVGNSLWDEFPDPPTEEIFRRAMRERTVITHEHYYAQLKEWVENRIYPSQDGGIAIYQRYVTDRKQAEEALRNAQAELAHVTRVTTMGELAASIAHQINQPLGAITNNGNAALQLLSGTRNVKELRATIVDIVDDANRASRIIERVRALTLKTMSKRASLDLRKSIDEVLAITRHKLAEEQILVKTHFARGLDGLWADRVQMQQVLFNLVRNSIDAMKIVPAKKRVLLIRTQRGGLEGKPAAIITVRDSGCGFKPEQAGRLFDAFYTTKADGMGMGLRISRSIVEAHGGVLSARRNSGPGATFRFTLPISHTRVT
jgi:signal transduction histidine kinase